MIVTSAYRYTSGVTVLATSTEIQRRVKNSIQLSKVSNDTMNLYYVVVVGSPNSLSGSFHLAIQMSSKVPNQVLFINKLLQGLKVFQCFCSMRLKSFIVPAYSCAILKVKSFETKNAQCKSSL